MLLRQDIIIIVISALVGIALAYAVHSLPQTIRIPLTLPPAVARRFVEDMRAFHAEPNAIKRDEIAARQLHGLKQHYAGKLRLSDVKEMFEQMKDHA